MDDIPNSTADTTTKATLTIGLLLFASVILGAGALGDDGGPNSANDERRDSDDAREDVRANDDMEPDLDRLGTACESGDAEACRQLEMMRTDRGDGVGDRPEMDVRDWDRERGSEGMDRDRRGGMNIDIEILVEMTEMWCDQHVYSTFWENTGDIHEGEEGFEIITYDEDGNEEGTFLSHDAMSQLLMGLEPLVESCTDMMLMQMGAPIHHDEHEDDWDEFDEWDDEGESDEWDDEGDEDESNIPDENDEDDEEQREG
ncbi:MAG: hypothetical protein VYB47_01105 [Candidatus Thermoplasmatota archaeon]|nr:hypothetical protein [Candidatus Thermoplasmatota archaeon]